MSEKKFLSFMSNRMLILTIFLGAALIGYTSGSVIAQEVKIGATDGTPFISFDDAMSSGMYEIRLNDGTGKFEIFDITNNRSTFVIKSDGNVGVGDVGNPLTTFFIECSTGNCNIQTRALDGSAKNSVQALGPTGSAQFKMKDSVTSKGEIKFDISTRDDGTVCMGDPAGDPCMLIFDINGTNPGQVKQSNGACIANC